MAFLLRRTIVALAGWYDTFDRPAENPIRKPWAAWGNPRTVVTNGAQMVLGNDNGWFQPNPDGGVAYEQQPLTPNWVVQFRRTLSNYDDDGELRVYLDKNWTAGGSAADTQYQTFIRLLQETTHDSNGNNRIDRSTQILTRDKSAWLNFAFRSYTMTDAEWSAPVDVKMMVLGDKTLVVWINGVLRMFGEITDTRYLMGPGKRSANFAQINGPVVGVDNFATYDRRPLRTGWQSSFYEDFNRTNSTTVGNGWTQAGSNFGINGNSLSLMDGFLSDGYRGIRRAGTSGDIRIDVTLGGGTSFSPNDTVESAVLARVNAAGTLGIGVFIHQSHVHISKWTGSLTNPTITKTFDNTKLPRNIANGQRFAFCFDGDEAWFTDIDTGSILLYMDGVNAISPPANQWFGAMIRRQSFTNSVPFNDYRAYTPI